MNLDNIISKFILGKSNKEEKQALELWKAESNENLDALKETIKIHELSYGLHQYQHVDTIKAWDKVAQRTQQETKIFSISKFIKVAAVFIVLIGSIFLFLPTSSSSGFVEVVHQSDQYKKLDLKDGSVIELDAKSELTELGVRKVSIMGRAYFDISPDKKHPFKVKTNHGELEVLGTEFNIFSSLEKSQIYVTEGRVVHHFLGKDYTLNVGDMIEIEGNNVKFSSNPLSQISAWKLKTLKFENESLKNVLESIGNYFKLEVEYQNDINQDKCKINTTFKDETIDQVLKELELIAGLKYKIINHKIIIKSFKC